MIKSHNTMEIHVNGKSYLINPLEHETDKVLASRLWFIIKQNPETDIDFQEAEKLSVMWYYMTYFKCAYHPDIEEKIKQISKNLYI